MSDRNVGKRFYSAEWADVTKEILIVGLGGIGSHTALNLARCGHNLFIQDGDVVDNTNISGGQLYRTKDDGETKCAAILNVIREFGCSENDIFVIDENFTEESEVFPITITGLDNMEARKTVFRMWKELVYSFVSIGQSVDGFLLIDGRLTMEMLEIYCVHGNNEEQMEAYEKEALFSDEESQELPCTGKQTFFAASMIGAIITGLVSNFIVNQKYGEQIREVPFYTRMHIPLMKMDIREKQLAQIL